MKKTFLFWTVLSFVSLNSYSQTNNSGSSKEYKTWSATLGGGSMLFYGDLRQYEYYPVGNSPYPKGVSERKWGFGLSLNKQIDSILAVQFQFQNGKLSGFKRYLDAYFITSFTEYGVNAIVNLRNLLFPDFANKRVSVYGILGLGFISYKAVQRSIKSGEEIYSYGYGLYGQKKGKVTKSLIPLGIGIKYNINDRFDAGLEVILNNVNTDQLDAREKPGTKKDKYGYTCLALTYKFGRDKKSLEWDVAKPQLFVKGGFDTDSVDTYEKPRDSARTEKATHKKEKEPKAEKQLQQSGSGEDADHDGVPDSQDRCPNTPTFALVDDYGCPYDADADGVPDYWDNCPDTPSDVKADSTGCPVDTDHDKVPDYLDQCPDTPKRAKVDLNGCPLDADGDGVFDYQDKCPDTAKGTKVDVDGCPF